MLVCTSVCSVRVGMALQIIKRPSQGKLKSTKSCWKTSTSWQTRSFTRQTRVKSQDTVICNMADLFSAVAITLNSETVEEERGNGKRGKIERFGRNPVCPLATPYSFVCFQHLCRLQMKRLTDRNYVHKTGKPRTDYPGQVGHVISELFSLV